MSISITAGDIGRAIYVILNAYCFQVGFTAPNPPPTPEETTKYDATAEKKQRADGNAKSRNTFPISVNAMILLGKFLWYGLTLVELAGIAADFGFSFDSTSLVRQQDRPELYISSESTIGLFLIASGTLLRLECFRRLNKSFTFQLSVKQDHKLITDGPYAVVRHPSYTGGLLTLIGGLLVQLGRGSWCAERMCGVDTTPWLGPLLGQWNWVGIIFGLSRVWMFSHMFRRCPIEDEVLKAHFQDEWVRWAQQVPYKMVPYVY